MSRCSSLLRLRLRGCAMRRLLCLAGLLIVTGCAPVREPVRIVSTSWDTVRALTPGTEIGLALEDDDVVYGRIQNVDTTALTIRYRHGAATIARPRIARLAIRTRAGTTRAPNILK